MHICYVLEKKSHGHLSEILDVMDHTFWNIGCLSNALGSSANNLIFMGNTLKISFHLGQNFQYLMHTFTTHSQTQKNISVFKKRDTTLEYVISCVQNDCDYL